MTTKQPEALRLANVCSNLTRYSMDAHLIAAELRTQHARITELESQLAQRFDAADMATAASQAVVQDDLITIRKPTTSAEMLWLLKLAHLVISDVDKTLEETFAPAQELRESFTAADMATAAASGFRDGVASVANQTAPDEIINMAREQGLPETEIEGVFRVNADDLCRVADAILAARRQGATNDR